jgi:hypothetical protein
MLTVVAPVSKCIFVSLESVKNEIEKVIRGEAAKLFTLVKNCGIVS